MTVPRGLLIDRRGGQAAVVDTGVAGSADAIGEALAAAGGSWQGVRHVLVTHYHGDHAGSIGDVLSRGRRSHRVRRPGRPRQNRPRQGRAAPGTDRGRRRSGGVRTAGRGPPGHTADPAQARRSVRRLADLPVRTVYFGHGDPIRQDAAAALRRLAGGTG